MTNFVNFDTESRMHALAVEIAECFPNDSTITLTSRQEPLALNVDWLVEKVASKSLRWTLTVVFDDPWAIKQLSEADSAKARGGNVKAKVTEYLKYLYGRKRAGEKMLTTFELHIASPQAAA